MLHKHREAHETAQIQAYQFKYSTKIFHDGVEEKQDDVNDREIRATYPNN